MQSQRPGEHTSRREIDMAIGVLMGTHRCSAREALEMLVDAARAAGIGLGGTSRALLNVLSGAVDPPAASDLLAHWSALLDVAPYRGN